MVEQTEAQRDWVVCLRSRGSGRAGIQLQVTPHWHFPLLCVPFWRTWSVVRFHPPGCECKFPDRSLGADILVLTAAYSRAYLINAESNPFQFSQQNFSALKSFLVECAGWGLDLCSVDLQSYIPAGHLLCPTLIRDGFTEFSLWGS